MESGSLLSDSYFCRLCCEENKNGISLFTDKKNSEDLGNLVNRYLPIKVDTDDAFPKLICPGCHIQLEAARLFMDLIIEGQAKLRDLLKAQQKRFEKESKLVQQFQEELHNRNPNANVETYTVQTDEDGEKFIIQIYSGGPLFLPEHELALKAQGKPKKKRGRPPKPTTDPEPEHTDPNPEAQEKDENTSKSESEDIVIEETTIMAEFEGGRTRRKIKAPARYEGAVQGKELDKILEKEGILDKDAVDSKKGGQNDEVDMQEGNEEETPIGIVTTDDGWEDTVYCRRRRPSGKKYRDISSFRIPHGIGKFEASVDGCDLLAEHCRKKAVLDRVATASLHPGVTALTAARDKHNLFLSRVLRETETNCFCLAQDIDNGRKQKQQYTCDICKIQYLHLGRFLLHRKTHKVKYACQGKKGSVCNFKKWDKNLVLEHQKETEHVGISMVEELCQYDGTVILPGPDKPSDAVSNPKESPENAPEISEEKPVKCPTCNKSYASKQNYEVHLTAIHDGKKPHKCRKCPRAYAYSSSLKNHMFSHKAKEKGVSDFLCDKCDKTFNHPSSLIYHKSTEHGNRRYVCNKCNKSFKHRQLLQRHQIAHTEERPFKCSECSTAFKTKTNLVNHENSHRGVKKFTCAICGQGFGHKTSLSVHMRWHEGDKPYKCDVCKKAFSQKGNLKEHTRIHTGERPFTCDLCDASFITSSQMRMHTKRHTGEKPHTCEYCQKRFLHKETFDTHIRRHLDIRPFKCTYCTKKFSESWACTRHQRIHLGDKRYRCVICDKSFTDASNFRKHTKIHQKNDIKSASLDGDAQNSKNAQFQQPAPIHIFISSDSTDAETEAATQEKARAELKKSNNLQIQELLDAEGNLIRLTTADGQPIPIVSSDREKIQGLMPDGTLVSFDILTAAEQNKGQQNEQAQEAPNQEMNLINTEIQFMEENSISTTSVEKPAFLSEDGKVCFITSFDENSFLTMS